MLVEGKIFVNKLFIVKDKKPIKSSGGCSCGALSVLLALACRFYYSTH